jgi:hypothetical protein
MGLPKKIKKDLSLIPKKTLLPRRHEIADMISEDGTYLPKSLLHADLDRGFLDFVKDGLKTVVEGKTVPMVDVLITTQNWAQFVETWNFENIDKNVEPPFITVIRTPEVKYGSNPAVMYNIPNRRLYYYAKVPTWDGQRHGMDIYKIPQPVPVDIKYTVAIVCNRMRELNKFNQIVLEKFSSRQSYQTIKGHYIPIVNDDISDESIMDLEKRKVYIQKYTFTMMGFLIDEDEFEVQPAVTRIFQIYETESKIKKKKPKKEVPNSPQTATFTYSDIDAEKEETFHYTVNMRFMDSENVDSYSVFINGDYYGDDVVVILVNSGDVIKITIIKDNPSEQSSIVFTEELL